MKPNHIKAALIIALMMSCSTSFAQLYKTDFTTKIVLTNSGFPVNPTFVYTLTAPPSLTGPLTLTLPPTQGSAGDVLTNTGGGILQWQNPLTSITLAGDVTGPAGTNTVVSVQPAAGATIATAINSSPTNIINGVQVSHDLTLTTSALTPFGLGINLTNDNSWTSTQTFSGANHGIVVDQNADFTLQGHTAALGNILTSDANGKASWTSLASVGVTSVTGTTDEVIVNGDLTNASHTGAITLTLPQAIGLTSSPTFSGLKLTSLVAQPGVVHNDNAGNLSSSAIVDADIQAGTITNAKLANNTIAVTSTLNTLTVTSSPIALGGSGNVELNLANDNIWNSTQTITGAGHSLTIDPTADLIVSGHSAAAGYVLTSDLNGKASWTDPGLSVNLLGDVTGPANNTKVNSVQLVAGPTIALAINNNTAPSLDGRQLNHDLTLSTGASTPFALGIDLNHSNAWNTTGGSQTFGATAQTPGTATAAAVIALSGTNTLYKINGGTGPVSGMTAGADGQNVTLTNTTASYIVLNANAGVATQFLIPGGDPVIMGPSATVMLQYDASGVGGWRVIGGF